MRSECEAGQGGSPLVAPVSLPPAHPLPVQGQPRAWLRPRTLGLTEEGRWPGLGPVEDLGSWPWCPTLSRSPASLSSEGRGCVLTAGIRVLFSTLASGGGQVSTGVPACRLQWCRSAQGRPSAGAKDRALLPAPIPPGVPAVARQ